MKLKIKIALSIILFALLLGGCRKQFLDLTPPNQLPSSEAIVDETSMQDAVNGMYSSMRAVDFFGRSIPLDGDLLADNIYIDPVQNSNRYLPEFTYTYTQDNADIQNMWSEAYNTILRANNIINANIPSSPVADQLKGEALTVRALSYFELVNFFAKPYNVDPTSPGVPLVLKYDAFAKPARNTVTEVYSQIQKDLMDAFNLMTDENKNSSYVTKYVAEGLLARVFQNTGDWTSAQDAALDVVNNGGYSLIDPSTFSTYWSNPFPVENRLETMFEVEFDNIGTNGVDDLDYFYSQEGYGDALCTDDLASQYSQTDVRGSLIVQDFRAGRPVLVVNKYPNTSNKNGKDNTKVLRYAEVLLILAEAYNRNSDDADAQIYLNMLAQTRDPAFAGYSDTGTDLLTDIYLERRKELAFEGHRYWDLIRLGGDITRNNFTDNYAPYVPLVLPASSTRRIFPIPRAELNANKNIVQNDGY